MALLAARRAKVGVQARGRLVVLAVEVGGMFSKEYGFLTGLAKARARSEPPLMQRRVEQAWRMRWSWLLGCAAAKAVADLRCKDASALMEHLQRGMRWKGTSVMPALPRRQA